MKALLLATIVAGDLLQGSSIAWDRCPPIDGCRWHECNLASGTNPDPEAPDNQQFGSLSGLIERNGTLTCTVQVGANDLHAETDATGASATGTNGVTVLSPQTITYQAEPLENVYLCDQFRDSGGTTYQYDDTDGAWEVANGTQACRLAISASTEDPLIQGIEEAIDGVICPVSGLLDPVDVPGVVTIDNDGDINVLNDEFWLCPPYEN